MSDVFGPAEGQLLTPASFPKNPKSPLIVHICIYKLLCVYLNVVFVFITSLVLSVHVLIQHCTYSTYFTMSAPETEYKTDKIG